MRSARQRAADSNTGCLNPDPQAGLDKRNFSAAKSANGVNDDDLPARGVRTKLLNHDILTGIGDDSGLQTGLPQ